VFAEDANNTLWVSSGVTGPGAFGWLNRKLFEETGDEVKSQGWSPFVLDTNGNGKRDEYLVAGSGLRFEERGTHSLKGVPGSWQLLAAA
jgi:hypothetical protein